MYLRGYFIAALTGFLHIRPSACQLTNDDSARYFNTTFGWNNKGSKNYGDVCTLPHILLNELELQILDPTKSMTAAQIADKLHTEKCKVEHFLECQAPEVDEYALTTEDPLDIREGTCQCSLSAGGKDSVVAEDGCRIPVGKLGLSACAGSQNQFKSSNYDQPIFTYPTCTKNAECRRDKAHPHYWCHCRIGYNLKDNGSCDLGPRNTPCTVLLLLFTLVVTVFNSSL